MNRRTRRVHHTLVAAALAVFGAVSVAAAAEISGASGIVTIVYDETIWSAGREAAGEPELTCADETCGGETAACTALVLPYEGDGLTRDYFLGDFREKLADAAVESAAANPQTSAEIVAPASVVNLGDNTAVTLSLRIAADGAPTRGDQVWFLAGLDLAGLACIVEDSEYDRTRPAFETLYSGLTIRSR